MPNARALPLVLLLFSAGCASSLASGHAPRVLPKGGFEAGVATGGLVPVGVLVKLVDSGIAAGKVIAKTAPGPDGVSVDEAVAKDAAVAAAALVVVPPALVTDLSLRYGVLEDLEVGLRLGGPAVRLESHYQLLRGDWNLVAGLAVARNTFDSSALSLLEKFRLASFSRTDLEAAVVAGREWEYGSFMFGPKALYAKFSAEGLLVDGDKVVVPARGGPAVEVLDLGGAWIYGGFLGGRVGYKYVWLAAELGVYGSRFAPKVLGESRDLGGLVVFPQVGLVGRLP